MPFTRCPSCQASLEVPAVVPGGVAACPYCGAEFPVKGGSGRGGRRPARRGRGGAGDDSEEQRPAIGYRRRMDPTPIILVVVILVVGTVAGVWYMSKKKDEEGQRAAIHQANMANVKNASVDRYNLPPDAPAGDTYDLMNVFHPGDRVTIMKYSRSFQLSHQPFKQPRQSLKQYVLEFKGEREAEKVVAFENDQSVHEGTYTISSFIVDGRVIHTGPYEAGFRLDRRGILVPGSFLQKGANLSPVPEGIADRNFGVLPDHTTRYNQTYGTATLPDPFRDHVLIDGRPLSSIGIQGRREGGWRISGGTLEKIESDMSWTHRAALDLRLAAYEDGVLKNFTYRGQPAELSYAMSWKAKAVYLLKSQILVQVDAMKIQFQARVKTPTDWHDWDGTDALDFQMYKDP
ncbi:MAG: hypothetical protein MUE73_16670 [Planctomycetes bacterium]|nr:hypothetical protein [Planctomycetota bacterium]